MSAIVQKLYTDYLAAYKMKVAAENQANSLKIISSDIYTEEERFVYELIQNAVDAYSDTQNTQLEIEIVLNDYYLVFMHNGCPFNDRDVEGICGIANGGKMSDTKKIGYKGIGFKSVFVHSNEVTISSGEHCFKFAESEWNNYGYKMPWQIIPIECKEPISLEGRNKYNVATFILLKHPERMLDTIAKLLNNSQFLLFLRCENARINFVHNGSVQTELLKNTNDKEVELSSNGSLDSKWMIHSIPESRAIVPDSTKELIANDEKTPNKLKESNYFDLSFAIKVDEESKIIKVEDEEAVLYTYLPTSMKSGFSFLVNANFITDAGRQQIHKDCEWNKFLYSVIPGEFLNWMAEISGKYKEDYYKVLPLHKKGTSVLDSIFNQSLNQALNEISFIPPVNGSSLLKVSEAVLDKIRITSAFEESIIICHINKVYSKNFKEDCFIANRGTTIFSDYGVFMFDKDKIIDLFKDNDIVANADVSFDIKLIRYLHEHTETIKNPNEQTSFLENLSKANIVLSDEEIMVSPSELFFPSDCKIGLTNDVRIVHERVYERITADEKKWLDTIGVKKQTPANYIYNVICKNEYVTIENAIEVGRFVFNAYYDGHLKRDELHRLSSLKFITKQDTLKGIGELYLGSIYQPKVDIEPETDEDLFVSEKYISNGNEEEWGKFFKAIGIKDKIELSTTRYSWSDLENVFGNERFTHIREMMSFDPSQYVHLYGVDFHYYPLVVRSTNTNLLKCVFSSILGSPYHNEDFSKFLEYRWSVEEHCRLRGDFWKKNFTNGFSLREYTLQNVQLFPTTTGEAMKSEDIFLNTPFNLAVGDKYLPIIDVDCDIDRTWINILNLKNNLSLQDYLEVLSCVANDLGTDNRERIELVYQKIVDDYNLEYDSSRAIISSWASNNKILASDGKFYLPAELSYVTLPGFEGGAQVYLSEHNAKLLPLFEAMGVKIITEDSLTLSIGEPQYEDESILRIFNERKCAITMLKAGKECNDEEFREAYREICDRLIKAHFYQCASIKVCSANFQKSMLSFCEEYNFYYIGRFSFAKMDALLTPLCNFMSIPGNERALLNVIFNTSDDLFEYFIDAGYNTDFLTELVELPAVTSAGDAILSGQIGGDINKAEQFEYSAEAKALVKTRLETEGFEFTEGLGQYSVITGVQKDGIEYPLVVKSCKNFEHKLHINPSEWEHLFRPNSMLWLHFGQGRIFPIKIKELFAYQDKLTLSFDSCNLQHNERLRKILNVMHYFNNVHFDVQGLMPDQNRGNSLQDYLFTTNNDGDDLSAVDSNIL